MENLEEKPRDKRGKYDSKNAILSIYAGAGGVDAQDWAEMLLRMYLKYAQKRGWRAQVLQVKAGKEAGIKNATLEIRGNSVYGFLKGEAGVHRLVRISPFNAAKLRHTSFALVEVLPEFEEPEVTIRPEDLRIDTYRASGPGGQYVNVTESAVRLTHLPTGLVAACQSERSQAENKKRALKLLYTKLHQYLVAKKEEEKVKLRGEQPSAEWGSQIRSYVLHPYKMVKDHRTGIKSSDPEKVLDGDLDKFVKASL
jgi:peptide chain release factor 2